MIFFRKHDKGKETFQNVPAKKSRKKVKFPGGKS